MDTKTGFSDSNEILSNSSSICCLGQASSDPSPSASASDVSGLNRLSENLHSIIELSDFEFFADARLAVAGGQEIPVHRCILSARSGFFRNVFSVSKDRGSRFELKDLAKDYEVGFDSVMAILGYLYSGKVRPLPKGVCVCVDEDCSHTACRPTVDFMVEVLYASFTFQVSELVALYQVALFSSAVLCWICSVLFLYIFILCLHVYTHEGFGLCSSMWVNLFSGITALYYTW